MPLQIRFKAITTKKGLIDVDRVIQELAAVQKEHLTGIHKVVSEYPVSRGGWYQRTYNLLYGWRLSQPEITSTEIKTKLRAGEGLSSKYAHLVHGKQQWALHAATGWRKLSDYLDRAGYLKKMRAVMRRNRGK